MFVAGAGVTFSIALSLGSAGCSVWGFDDLSQGRDAGTQDGATPDSGTCTDGPCGTEQRCAGGVCT